MRRADRLFQIVQYLRAGRLLTAKRLAERLEVSERTIYRDIADLQASGVPIDGEAGIGYLMREGYDLPPLMFSREEIAALIVGARFTGAWGGAKMALAAETALAKIDNVLPDDMRGQAQKTPVYALGFQMNAAERVLIDRCNSAILTQTVLDIAYEDGAGAYTEREIEPLGLYYWGKTWTLAAWCRLRADFRAFRIDRIATAQTLEERFTVQKGRTLRDYLMAEAQRVGFEPPASMLP